MLEILFKIRCEYLFSIYKKIRKIFIIFKKINIILNLLIDFKIFDQIFEKNTVSQPVQRIYFMNALLNFFF